ncbi:MAG: hypothetical protein KatS3mg068_2164 [Candidatus Sericytochromatia bacterium]|nr:MAG: hypothetical protein KatS3mg068_2164 [Candidatus Sericytochromatia bacterium]
MLKKFISSSLIFSLLINPVLAHERYQKHNHDEHHEHHHDMKMNFHYHKMDENTIKMMKENYESAKVLFNKGVEVVKEGNKKLSVEQMLQGLALIRMSMDISYHPAMKMMLMPYKKEECKACNLNKNDMKKDHECKECSLKRKEHEEFAKKLGYSKEDHEKMTKDLSEVAMLLMNTGNKLIQEGNKENNLSKIENGAKLTREGFMLHHYKNKPMMHIEKKVIIKK